MESFHETSPENQARRRQKNFRTAAEYVARAMKEIPAVEKIELFGSVAKALPDETARSPGRRRAGARRLHQCKDVDLAVWVNDLDCLRALQIARSRAVNQLWEEREIGVAHHQVDVFVMDADSSRYLGRLCIYGQCPKGKPECQVVGCVRNPF